MGIFRKKDVSRPMDYDRENMIPQLHKSICTGETTAGFLHLDTGRYEDLMLIRTEEDLQTFMHQYGLTERPKTVY